MAKSFSHGGVKSMNVDPSATKGAEEVAKNTETNCATANRTAAEMNPASPKANSSKRLDLIT